MFLMFMLNNNKYNLNDTNTTIGLLVLGFIRAFSQLISLIACVIWPWPFNASSSLHLLDLDQQVEPVKHSQAKRHVCKVLIANTTIQFHCQVQFSDDIAMANLDQNPECRRKHMQRDFIR